MIRAWCSRPIRLRSRPAIPLDALWTSFIRALRAEGVKPLKVIAYTQARDAFTTYAAHQDIPTAPALVDAMAQPLYRSASCQNSSWSSLTFSGC